MENLNKQNFWNRVYEKYPSVQVFCDWIDEYKKNNNWDELFNGGINYKDYNPKTEEWDKFEQTKSPKFHDLTIAMQWGIFQQFCAENHPSGFGGIESAFEHPKDMEKIPEFIEEYFAEMQSSSDNERMNMKYN